MIAAPFKVVRMTFSENRFPLFLVMR